MIIIKLITITISLIAGIGTQSCLPLTSKNFYGDQRSWMKGDATCFEISISNLKEIIVHTLTSVVGFTFILLDGQNKSYLENCDIDIVHIFKQQNDAQLLTVCIC